MMKRVLAVLGLTLITNPTWAANEGVCDALVDQTPGLYGLCVAFWAQSCELDFNADNPFEDCNAGASKLLFLYEKKAGAGDPPMPGIPAPCPCWSEGELDPLAEGEANFCGVSNRGITGISGYSVMGSRAFEHFETAQSSPPGIFGSCWYREISSTPIIDRTLPVSTEQHLACAESALDECFRRGV
jgi:hypothetical protein